ncbi:hypothetical protein [Bradyrhizobium sp. 1]|uniref:hypothetical protein n=1 Tax=Bradyrhizobium sp. 1 TaxID=241591 RepID=UPI001FF7C63E|nr:hypothetical protein [Bradyrhizobium sp. 1]MCK1396119.1 hypothetical protein [Bradyrhizobium sp. 1]
MKTALGPRQQQTAAFADHKTAVAIFATTLLLAGSFVLTDPGHVQSNAMLRYASVDHDMAKVKRRIEQTLHDSAGPTRQAFTSTEPPIAR